MTTDLIALAKQAGLMPYTVAKNHKALQAFANLIRQDEREACAQLCKTVKCYGLLGADPEYMAGKEMAKHQCIDSIRGRK